MPDPYQNRPPRSTSQSCVILVAGLLVVIFFCGFGEVIFSNPEGQRIQSVNKAKNIVLGLRTYSSENDGFFPNRFNDGKPFTSSQDAFNILIPDIITVEQTFWTRTNESRKAPDENNNLTKDECGYGYVSGQTESSSPDSPLVFEGGLNRSDLSCSERMPFLDQAIAIVGFVDGSVLQLPLSSNQPGATIQNPYRKKKVDNIFVEIDKGGSLDTDPKNILLPIGY